MELTTYKEATAAAVAAVVVGVATSSSPMAAVEVTTKEVMAKAKEATISSNRVVVNGEKRLSGLHAPRSPSQNHLTERYSKCEGGWLTVRWLSKSKRTSLLQVLDRNYVQSAPTSQFHNMATGR
jgi:hypothetical protein